MHFSESASNRRPLNRATSSMEEEVDEEEEIPPEIADLSPEEQRRWIFRGTYFTSGVKRLITIQQNRFTGWDWVQPLCYYLVTLW